MNEKIKTDIAGLRTLMGVTLRHLEALTDLMAEVSRRNAGQDPQDPQDPGDPDDDGWDVDPEDQGDHR
jgi:hypothetical protein